MELTARLVGEARERQPRVMAWRERAVVGGLSLGFALAAAAVLVLLPPQRSADPLLLVALVVTYAAVSRVEFEVGSGYAVPGQLVFVPMLFLAPLHLVPLLIAAGFLLADAPDFLRGATHVDRWLNALSDSWYTIGPVVVIGLLAPGEPRLELVEVYALALAVQVGGDAAAAVVRERLAHGVSIRATLGAAAWSYRIDAVLSPVGLMVALAAADKALSVIAVGPLVWLLSVFARERRERYAAALELNRAYQGTVMLLADVVEAEDNYTADHCRSVVELANATADELGIDDDARQELEFAALLHDVGKLAIPKEILNKPGALTDEEWKLMKTHTIEGQLMLDRVGGLLTRVGRIVRSCHERWDGNGYPDGLAGTEIPLASRIVFCCDAYNAMTTDRPYRAAMSRDDAIGELVTNAGTQFDPRVVAAVCDVTRRGELELGRSPAEEVRALIANRPPQLPAGEHALTVR